MIRGLVLVCALLPLAGCVTIATINVDGKRAATYVVPFGGVAITRGHADAVEVKALAFGAVRACGLLAIGAVSCRDTHADPSSNVAIFNGRFIGRLTARSFTNPRSQDHAQIDPILRSAGADR